MRIDSYEAVVSFIRNECRPKNTIVEAVSLIRPVFNTTIRDWLVKVIQTEESIIQSEALDLLSRFDIDTGSSIANGWLKDPSPKRRWVACELIETVRAVQCEDSLIDLLHHELDSEVRYAAVSALGAIGSQKSIKILEHIISFDLSTDF